MIFYCDFCAERTKAKESCRLCGQLCCSAHLLQVGWTGGDRRSAKEGAGDDDLSLWLHERLNHGWLCPSCASRPLSKLVLDLRKKREHIPTSAWGRIGIIS